MTKLNADGQPQAPFPRNWMINANKTIDQLVGLSRGILCDGIVNQAEADAFRRWVESAPEIGWPIAQLRDRLGAIYRDGKADEDELKELAEIMRQLSGATEEEPMAAGSTSLPFDDPPPQVYCQGREFCVTGKFAFGKRTLVEEAIASRGGWTNDNPREATHFLLVGVFASRDWIHTTYGRKIERAVELRKGGHRIQIVSEKTWLECLK